MRIKKETTKHLGKRALALFLSLVMCISMLQISAFAAEPQMSKAEQAKLQIEGVEDAANGGADKWAPYYYTYDTTQQKFTTKDDVAQVNSPDSTNPEEHKVEVSKTIEATGTENLFDITLDVRTKQDISTASKSPDSAVTLVIDVSGSMEDCAECGNSKESHHSFRDDGYWWFGILIGKDGKCDECGLTADKHHTYESRLAAAKRTAIQFLEDYAESANGAHRYVSIVKFSSGAYEVSGWEDAAAMSWDDTATNSLKTAINGLVAGGGTNIDAGLRVAYAHLKQKASIDYRYCILLTDGEPTYYYNTEFTTDSSATSYDPGKKSNWGYKNLGGKGSDSSDRNCAGYAETVATAIKGLKSTASLQRNVTLYSVYYGQANDTLKNSNGENQKIQSWLTGISSTEAFLASNTSGLLESFQSILNTITMVANAWIVTDPMGDYITLEEDSPVNSGIVTDNLNGTRAKEYNSATKELTWRLPMEDPDGQDWRTYTMTYRVRLNTDADGFDFNKFYQTNGDTTLEYNFTSTDASTGETYLVTENGDRVYKEGTLTLNEGIDAKWKNNQTLHFKVPAVQGVKTEFSFIKTGLNNEKIDTYSGDQVFKLTSASGKVYYGTALNGIVTFTNIPSGYTYTLEEITAPDGYERSSDVYQVTIEGGQVTDITAKEGNSAANGCVQYADGKLMFFDELSPKETNIQITKKWAKDIVPDGVDSLTVTLEAKVNGVRNEKKDEVVTLTKEGGWTATVTVPTVDVTNNGHITYDLVEPESAAYDKIGLSGGYVLNQKDPNGIDRYAPIVLTNSATGDVSISKTWVGDASVSSVQVKVYVGDTYKQTVTLSAPNWTSTAKLPLYDASGKEIAYNFKELDGNGNWIPAGGTVDLNGKSYTMTVSGNTITNTIQQKAASLTVNKIWKVGSDSYTAEFKLLADGKDTGLTQTITSEQSVATFEKLPKYAVAYTANDAWVDYSGWGLTLDGHDIDYTLQETVTDATGAAAGNVSGVVTTEMAEDANGNYSITYTNTRQEYKTVTLTKEFEDEDFEKFRPETVTLRLSGSDGKDYDVELSDFYDMVDVENGDGTITQEDDDTITQEKVWKNSASGTVTVPLYDENGAPITYTFSEVGTDNGILTVNGVEYAMTEKAGSSMENGYTAVNTLEGGETSIQVQKIWVDAETDDTRNVSTTISVMKDGQVATDVEGKECSWTTSKDGTTTFTLPRFENGVEIPYTVKETAVEGYNNGQPATATWDNNSTYVFTNVISDKDATVSISGTKTWEGGDASFRPTVTMTLWKNGSETQQTTELDSEGKFSFSDLPKYTVTGNRCTLNTYAVAEAMTGAAAEYYTAEGGAQKDVAWNDAHDEGTVAFTNKFDPKGTDGGLEIGGSKIWVDGSVTHTETIKVGLWNGTEIVDTRDINNESNYAFKFTGLDEVDAQGNTITYTVYEMDGDTPVGMDENGNRTDGGKITIGDKDYAVSYVGNAIYNTRAQEDKELEVTKYWYGPACPISFTVYVKDTDTVVKTLTMAADAENTTVDGNKWTASVTVPKYDDDRNEIHYEIREDGVGDNDLVTFNGSSYKAEASQGNVFVNTVQQVNDVNVKVTKVWENTNQAVSSQPEKIRVYLLRDTGIYDKSGDGEIGIDDTYELTQNDNWTLTIENLPRFKDNNSGEESIYSIQEFGYDQASGTVKHGNDYYKAAVTRATESTDATFDLTLTNTCLGHYAYIINRHYSYTDSSAKKTDWVESTDVIYGSKDEQVSYNGGDYLQPTEKHTSITFGFDGGTVNNEQCDTITIAAGDVTEKSMKLVNMDLFIVDLYYSKTETYVPPVVPVVPGGSGGSGDDYPPYNPPAVIEEPEIPLAPMPEEPVDPEIEIPEDETPLEEIPDEDVPLTEIPETGDAMALYTALSILSGMGLAGLGLTSRKRKEEDAE